jgi:hypothetical protein
MNYFASDADDNPTFYAELANPQSLNKYQYCLNNPLRYIDPDGHQQQDGKSSNIVDRIIKSANEILGSLFASLQRAARKDGAPEEERRPGPYGNKDQIIQAYMDRVGESTEAHMNVLMLFDVTGAGGLARSLLNHEFRGGDKTDVAIAVAAVVFAQGGGPTKLTLGEAKGLIGAWARDPVQNTIAASIKYHFGKHGAEVGASNVWQYLRKAEGFARNLRGASVIELENGAKRYVKKGYYLIKDGAGKIISYGRESQ